MDSRSDGVSNFNEKKFLCCVFWLCYWIVSHEIKVMCSIPWVWFIRRGKGRVNQSIEGCLRTVISEASNSDISSRGVALGDVYQSAGKHLGVF